MRRGLKLILVLPAILCWWQELSGQTQLCSGSLGEPIINMTFGSGPGFGPALDAGVTTYQYVPGPVNDDGQYTLASNVNYAKSDWHFLEDHTPGDINGYMLVVNADLAKGEFYRGLVSGLCENTTFEFSAWITNANTPPTCAYHSIRPNIEFRIEDMDGTILARTTTGDIDTSAVPRWENYGFTFTTDNKTEFYLVMVNNNGGGCGNDLAIDDITFRACGPSLLVNAEGYSSAEMPYVCPGARIDLESVVGSEFPDPLYQWQASDDDGLTWLDLPGEDTNELNGIIAGDTRSFRVVAAANAANLLSPFCRVVSNPVKITVVPPLTIEQEPADLSACLNEQPFFEIAASGGYPEPEYRWESSSSPNGPWAPAEAAPESTPPNRYYPPITAPGDYYYRCIVSTAAQGCQPLASRAAKLSILPPVVTLDLPVETICAGQEPLLLTGGQPLRQQNDQTGIYSGKGVINGYFDPQAAGGPGTYEITYTLSNTSGCQYVANDMITVHPPAVAEAGADRKMLEGTFTTLNGAGNGVSFSWSPAAGLDDPQQASPRASPPETTTYTLTVTTAGGCTATDTVRVEVLEKLLIPSAFTPNQDGVNDTWDIHGISGYPEASVKVFNRWGTTVFRSKGYHIPWDGAARGALLPDGTYYYLIIPGIFLEPVSGSVTIVR
ncbi:gliding motility-associated-like protein [Anseongella ginsenosidimutans]|uniref:Gliding motility-associated-like protein n=2 Tax=Anseongella ginsenosidimutans TaxID=496056 RepID=A0A4R3KPZ4_9SPHI|nr:gliding motility-associated-like protein [Anseongella ginsenosidimutans]